MNIYIAAMYTNNYRHGMRNYAHLTPYEASLCDGVQNILESYHYVKDQYFIDHMRQNKAKVFLDSGAFSAHTLNKPIAIDDYIKYIYANKDLIKVEDGVLMASVLDGIGDAQLTLDNQLYMQKRGITPLPCFHANEDFSYLEYYVKNYEYMTLGGMVGASTEQLMYWLDVVWDKYLTDGSGNPRLKVHGFGITSIPLMERYPWHSCDSSSWIQAAAYGSIFDAKYSNLCVSKESPARRQIGQHYDSLIPIEKEIWFKNLEEMGFTIQRLGDCYQSRAVYNIYSYVLTMDRINKMCVKDFQASQEGLF